MKSRKAQSRHSVAELFCGCGGFSHGFWRTGRFRIIFGNDIKKFALRTFELNHTHDGEPPFILKNDIRTVPDRQIIELLDSRGIKNLDCLLGGPPCQGFSQMRRTEARRGSKIVRFGGYNKLDEDPRNDLVLRFLEITAALNPKVIVIENVPQFLSHYHNGKRGGVAQQVEEVLKELGYHVTCDILNAADYGVPQLRQRAVILASRLGPISLPAATHGDPRVLTIWKLKPWVTVQDALADLPAEPPIRDTLGGIRNGYLSDPNNDFVMRMRTSEVFPYNHITRAYQRRIINIIQQMHPGETWDEASDRLRAHFDTLVEKAVLKGESRAGARKRLEAEGRIFPVFYKRYYWSAYTRLAWDRPALTITANSNFLGSGRFTHPDFDRGITMREAARLQSFDDAFTFYTSDDPKKVTENIGVGLDMIGEAVPPLLGTAIGEAVAAHLDEMEEVRRAGTA
jgi:DNA (cytosine-5)-methyltransferase 1